MKNKYKQTAEKTAVEEQTYIIQENGENDAGKTNRA